MKYIRELTLLMFTVKEMKRDTPSPTGRESNLVVLEDAEGRRIDAKFNLYKDPRTGEIAYDRKARESAECLWNALGVPYGDKRGAIGRKVIALVEYNDTPQKRYWNVTRFWPASEWEPNGNHHTMSGFDGDSNFGGDSF